MAQRYGGGGYDRGPPDDHRRRESHSRQYGQQDPQRGGYGGDRGHHQGGRRDSGPSGGGRGRGGGKYAPLEAFPSDGQDRKLELLVNHYTFTADTNRIFYMYKVTFAADLSRKRQGQVLRLHKDAMMLGGLYVFKNECLFTTTQIATGTFTVANNPEDNITVTLATQVCYDSNGRDQVYNVVMNNIMTRALALRRLGRWHYNPGEETSSRDLSAFGLCMWPGFMTSVVQTQAGLCWAIDLHHKMIQTNTLLDTYQRLGSNRREFEEAVTNKIVFTTYNNRTYRVMGVDWNHSPADSFDNGGRPVTYGQYAVTRYNVRMPSNNQPLLLAEARGQTIRLIPELCTLTGLDSNQHKNARVRKAVVAAGQVDPDDRLTRLNGLPAKVHGSELASSTMQDWGIALAATPSDIKGTQLRPEVVFTVDPEGNPQSGDMQDLGQGDTFDWTRLLFTQLLAPLPITTWWLLHDKRDDWEAGMVVHHMRTIMGAWGVDPGNPTRVLDTRGSEGSVFCKALAGEKAHGVPDPGLVVVLLPDTSVDRYNMVKRYCSFELGVPSQCITKGHFKQDRFVKSVMTKVKSVMTKVCLQMQAKVGGQLWCATPVPSRIRNMMVVGIDVNHDVARGSRSVMGFCASLNPHFTQYYSVAAQQEHEHEEIVRQLDVHMGNALDAYYRCNGTYPETVIVYRDGVSDGELQGVRQEEVGAILQAISIRQQRLQKGDHEWLEPLDDHCQLCFFVLKKRITQKLFHTHGGRVYNPPPGTCTEDDKACGPDNFNFYLVSQKTNQGTVSPTHFNLLYHSESHQLDKWIARKLHQRLAYKLTHLYYNWPGTIRVPAPCQYAHTLAFKVGMHLGGRNPEANGMDTLLHYL